MSDSGRLHQTLDYDQIPHIVRVYYNVALDVNSRMQTLIFRMLCRLIAPVLSCSTDVIRSDGLNSRR